MATTTEYWFEYEYGEIINNRLVKFDETEYNIYQDECLYMPIISIPGEPKEPGKYWLSGCYEEDGPIDSHFDVFETKEESIEYDMINYEKLVFSSVIDKVWEYPIFIKAFDNTGKLLEISDIMKMEEFPFDEDTFRKKVLHESRDKLKRNGIIGIDYPNAIFIAKLVNIE